MTDLHELNDSQLKTHLIAGLMDSYLVYTSACFRMIGEDFQELIDGSGDSEGMPTTISYVKTRTCHLMSCHSFGKKMDLMTALEKEFDLPRHSIQQLPGQKNVSNEILRFPLSIPEERNLLVPTITSLPQDVTKHIVSFLPTFTPLDKKMLCLMGKHMRLVEELIQYLENSWTAVLEIWERTNFRTTILSVMLPFVGFANTSTIQFCMDSLKASTQITNLSGLWLFDKAVNKIFWTHTSPYTTDPTKQWTIGGSSRIQ